MANICVFGDSITWGANDSEQGGWVNRLRNYYQSKGLRVDKDVDVYNLGVSGDNTEDLLKRFQVELEARLGEKITFVVFAIGINDSQFVISKNENRIPVEIFQVNLKTLIKEAKKYTDKIAFVGLTQVDESKTVPIPWNKDKRYTNDDIEKYNEIIQIVADEEGTVYIDMKGVVGLENLGDVLHTDSEGHRKMFEKVKEHSFFRQD